MLKLRLATALALTAGATLFVGSPAFAWPGARVTCDPSHNAYFCTLGISGTPTPSAIRWYQDGFHLSAFDNLTRASGRCTGGHAATVTVKLTYAYPDGSTVEGQTGDSFICEGNE